MYIGTRDLAVLFYRAYFCKHLCRYHRASPTTFETVSILDWQNLNLAHEVLTGMAPR